jgi:diguanylate cyclase (GGDEF)-like protein
MADITQRKQDEERIRHMAMYDPLTELPNRRLFFDRLHQILVYSRRNKTLAALLYVDLDAFKQINDVYGHQAGDETLLEVVRRIRSNLRKSDTVARLGGDEFAVILRDLGDKKHAASVADKIIKAVKKPLENIDRRASLGASIGIAFNDGTEKDLDSFLKKADSAMYEAKNAGGNRVRIYEEKEV